MNYELGVAVAFSVLLAFSFFLWGRGMVKSRQDDLALGLGLFMLLCALSFVASSSSAVFSTVGTYCFAFGLETLIVGRFAREACPIKKRDRTALAALFAIGGLLASMIV